MRIRQIPLKQQQFKPSHIFLSYFAVPGYSFARALEGKQKNGDDTSLLFCLVARPNSCCEVYFLWCNNLLAIISEWVENA